MKTGFAMRHAVPEDAGAIRDLVRQAYAKWVPLVGREPKPMGADYDQAVREHIVWVATDNQKVVAVLELIPNTDHLLVENLAVALSHQGQGIAKQLMELAELTVNELGMSELRLYTNELFAANLSLYNSIGYVETQRQDFPHLGGTNNTTVFMTKRVEASQ